MTTLHMKTEEVRHVAHRIDLAVGDLYFKPGSFKSAAGSIRSAWQGGRSAYYASQLQQMGNLLRDEILDLQRLVKRLYIEVNEWEDADSIGTSAWNTIGMGISAMGGIGIAATSLEKYNWRAWWNSLFTIGSGIFSSDNIQQLSRIPYNSINTVGYHGVGRLLNFLSGSRNAGWVGRMDDLGHLIKNPRLLKASKALPLIGYGIGVYNDIQDGDDWGRALVSEIPDAAVGLIPVVGYYNLYLAFRELHAGHVELTGNHDRALELQEKISRQDITENLGDAIYDYITQHPLSAARSLSNPFALIYDPEYIRFAGSFWSDSLEGFEQHEASVWVSNNTEMWAEFTESFGFTHPENVFRMLSK